jgi:hypothetical protein
MRLVVITAFLITIGGGCGGGDVASTGDPIAADPTPTSAGTETPDTPPDQQAASGDPAGEPVPPSEPPPPVPPPAPTDLPSRERLEAAIAAARRLRPCGDYRATGDTIWPRLAFGDGHRAWVFLSEEARPDERTDDRLRAWLPVDGGVAVRNDRGYFILATRDGRTLRGRDDWTDGDVWRRSSAPPAPCAEVAATPEERTRFAHELCEYDGFVMQRSMDTDGALELFERCCTGGAAASCDRAGQIREVLRRDAARAEPLYRSACEGGHPRGCYDLGVLLRRAGRQREALDALGRGCELGFIEACVEPDAE